MSITSLHPAYTDFIVDWNLLRDVYRGERIIKQKGEVYLPATNGMLIDGMGIGQVGRSAYESYKKRAIFHDFVRDAVHSMIGKMHTKPPVIKLPRALEPLREHATVDGQGLEGLLRRINEQQLVTGRVGLLADIPNNPKLGNDLPYLAVYKAESILNWDDGSIDELEIPKLNLVVLDESEYERGNDLTWSWVDKYRALVLGDVSLNENDAIYRTGIIAGNSSLRLSEIDLVVPVVRGKSLNEIPFVMINSKDLVNEPDDPPLLGLAHLSLAIYRGEADYRQNLFQQSQDTLVVIGSTEEKIRVGAGATLALPHGGDAKYVGVGAHGLSEQRQSLQNDMLLASHKAGHLIDTRSREKESGDALQVRVSSQTATLTQIALTGAMGLQKILRIVATWVGADPLEVVVTANLDFVNAGINSKTLVELMNAKAMGAPISLKSVHDLMRDRGVTTMEFDAELAEIEQEGFNDAIEVGMQGVSGDNDSEDDQ